jgi:exonuclease VII small subunit
MAKQPANFNYVAAKKELIDLLDWFESGNADLDKALENYKKPKS